MINEKFKQKAPNVWSILENVDLINQVLHGILNKDLEWNHKQNLVLFLVKVFQSLEHPLVRQAAKPLVDISIWNCLVDTDARDAQLANPALLSLFAKTEKKKLKAGKKQGYLFTVRFQGQKGIGISSFIPFQSDQVVPGLPQRKV